MKNADIDDFFSTLKQQFLKKITGNSIQFKYVTDRDVLFEKQASITPEKLENILTRWIADEYHQTRHSGLNEKTPQQVWES